MLLTKIQSGGVIDQRDSRDQVRKASATRRGR